MIFVVQLFTCLAVLCFGVQCYKPVIFMHGVTGNIESADYLFKWIKEAHPGTQTLAISSYQNAKSLTNMITQVENIKKEMAAYMAQHPSGVNMICFSQGGLICRGVLENLRHNVDTFVSLSSPQAGQFAPLDIPGVFNGPIKYIYKFAYTWMGQLISVFNYWNDPYQQVQYRQYCQFLPVLNNETYNDQSQMFKSNFLRLKKLVLIGGPNDGVIGPWKSSQFGFYDNQMKIVDMEKEKWYTEDSFGLQTLDNRGALVRHTVPGIYHTDFYRERNVFNNFILPYLN